MVGLAKSCSGGGALANYVLDEEKGYELDRNLVCGDTPQEIVQEMKMIQDLNQRATNKTLSLVLSPDVKDGKKLSDKELKKMTQDYLNKLGIDTEKQQYVAFVHTEKEHKHIHIIANRVQTNGKLISDHHIGKRGQWVAHEIAKERGLVSAKQKMFDNIKKIEQDKTDLKSERSDIFKKHQKVINKSPKTFSNYIVEMQKVGLDVKPTINKQNQIQGFRVIEKGTGVNYKMSEINRSMSASNLIKSGLKNDLKNELHSSLKKFETKEISKIPIKINKVKINGLNPTKTGIGRSLSKSFLKQKMSKEEYLKSLKFDKHINEIVTPDLIVKEQNNISEKEKLDTLEKREAIKKETPNKEIKQRDLEL